MDILLVDDNEDYLFLVKQVLDQNGYTVHTAKDGMEGCEVLTRKDIDLIISDIRMPRLDGVKMHAFAREIDRYKKTKFIFISGFREVYSEVINLDPKLDFLVDKTTSVTELLRFVDELVFGRIAGAWS